MEESFNILQNNFHLNDVKLGVGSTYMMEDKICTLFKTTIQNYMVKSHLNLFSRSCVTTGNCHCTCSNTFSLIEEELPHTITFIIKNNNDQRFMWSVLACDKTFIQRKNMSVLPLSAWKERANLPYGQILSPTCHQPTLSAAGSI